MTQTTVEADSRSATRPTRADIAAALSNALIEVIPAAGCRAGWQGAEGALAAWLVDTGPSDLDLWADESAARVLDGLLGALPAAKVQYADDPGRLRDTSYAIETDAGLAIVDVTRGDLMVGPIVLMPAADVTLSPGPDGPRLTGAAAVADLVLRKLLRGGCPPEERLNQARAEWASLSAAQRAKAIDGWEAGLGRPFIDRVQLLLVDRTLSASPALAQQARHGLLKASLKPANLGSTWRARRVVVPAGHRAGPLGLRTRGVVVVLIGTDGSGKSTVAHSLSDRLVRSGFDVASPYFGMARGNLPGVNLARKIFGVATEPEDPKPASDSSQKLPQMAGEPNSADGETESSSAAEVLVAHDQKPTQLGHPRVRQIAAWYYAGEYVLRWLREVAPALATRKIVVADRYVYDLRESPWPGSPAARFVEALLPAPDFLVLPDAPDDMIHARKPERPAVEQAAQQERFRELVAQDPAAIESVRVDSSGATADSLADLLAKVVQAAHQRPGTDRP